jgi:beta-lactamase regulating signal transducer with metallopeptidase domain
MLLSGEPSIQTGFAAVDQAVNPVLAESLAPAVGDSVNPLQVWVHVGAVLWLCGLAAMLLYAVVSYLRLRRRVAESVPLRENIRLSDRIVSPFVLGMIRPKIYLPFGLSEETMALVLAHEQGHIARHDHWFKPFGFLLLSLCWFHPLAWLAYVLYCRDIELACDEHVLRSWGPAV